LTSLRAAQAAATLLAREFPSFAALHGEAVARELAARTAAPATPPLQGRAALIDGARCQALAGGTPWKDRALAAAIAAAPVRGASAPGVAIWGEAMPLADGAGKDGKTGADGQRPALGASEAAAKRRDHVNRIELDEREQQEHVLLHTFEKVETIDQWRGGSRDADGSDELEDQLEAMSDCDLREVIRGGEQPHSLYRLDLQLDSGAGDAADDGAAGLPYDEWDHRARAYRRGWCTVVPGAWNRRDATWTNAALARQHTLIKRVTRAIEAQRTELSPARRQLDGEDVDLEALVDELAARRAGHGGADRLYERRARRRRDIATTVLIDISLSTDAWVAGLRALDVAREALLVLGEVSERLGDRIEVLGFSSNTRNRCRVWRLRGRDEPWAAARARIGGLEPTGYTRIGPALRHATAGLVAEPADRRLLLLISDCKPTDYDRYEGRYGIADVRQALIEARSIGVHVHALTIDASARDHLPAMFGPGCWHLMPRPDALPEALAKIYGQLTS
jgi:nitric oxide reductase NorD protein